MNTKISNIIGVILLALAFCILIGASALLGKIVPLYKAPNKEVTPVSTEKVVVIEEETSRPIIVDEDAVIKNMVSFFKSLPKDKREDIYFSLSYWEKTGVYWARVTYKNCEYSNKFDTYEDMLDFVSDPQMYYYDVVPAVYR